MRRTRAQPTTLRPATGRPRGLNPLRILLTLLTEGKPRGLNLPLKRMPVWCTQMMPGPQDLSYHASRREENLAMGFRSAHAPASVLIRDRMRSSRGLPPPPPPCLDTDLCRVPDEMKTFLYGEEETRRICDLSYESLDPLNEGVLRLRGEEVGTTFLKHNAKTVYHDGDMLRHITELHGKLFETLGYPRLVASEEGLSYVDFMKKIARLQKFAMALSPTEQSSAYATIDDYVLRAHKAAGELAKRTIYGPCPADKRLRAWVHAEEPVVIELKDLLESIAEVTSYRRRTGTIFGPKPLAATLAGYSTAGASSSQAKGAGAPPTPQSKKNRRGKGAAAAAGPSKLPAPKQPAPKQPTPKAPPSKQATPSNQCKPKKIFMYEDGTYTIGGIFVNFPKICQHFKWGDHTKLCGPVCMGAKSPTTNAAENCPWGHASNAPEHKVPKVNGKDFALLDHLKELNDKKLTQKRPELLKEKNPPGTAKRVGATLVYPARHFG